MALLFALIFRAVSMEFRSKHDGKTWRAFWDTAFCAASTLATFLYGVAVSNAMAGMPINEHHEFVGGTLDLLRPYPILVGLFAVAVKGELPDLVGSRT
jgi:cytochrome d ubiquinol oxidase subunit II